MSASSQSLSPPILPTLKSNSLTGDESSAKKGKRAKDILVLGDGTFSYSVAYRKKHPHSSMIATELMSEREVNSCHTHRAITTMEVDPVMISGLKHSEEEVSSKEKLLIDFDRTTCSTCQQIASNLNFLKMSNVDLFFEIDATKLETYDVFKRKNFDCIHWNIPHDGSADPSKTLPSLMQQFFQSCAKMQSPNQHVHISIPQPEGKELFYFSNNYSLLEAATNSNYTLHKKRAFVYPSLDPSKPFSSPCRLPNGKIWEKQRYEGYEHVYTITGSPSSYSNNVALGAREFVFKKVDPKTINWSNEPSRDLSDMAAMKACPLKATLLRAAHLAKSTEKLFNLSYFEKNEQGSYALPKDRRGCYVSVADKVNIVETDCDSSESELDT